MGGAVAGEEAQGASAERAIREAFSAVPRDAGEAAERMLRVLLAVPADRAADPAVVSPITRDRIRVTRTHGSAVADLVDARLVLDVLGASDEPRRGDLLAIWAPYIEGAAAGAYTPNPALFQPPQPARSPAFRALLTTMHSYFRAGSWWCERSGIPRRWLLDARGVSRIRLARYIGTAMGGFRPVWQTHLGPLGAGEHLTEPFYVRSHLEIARALARHPSVRGIASSSWYNDPDLTPVSPRLAFVSRILAGNGCLCFEVPIDEAMRESALRTSRTRREAHERGAYTPRSYARLWGRADMLRWAAAQPDWQPGPT